MSDVRINTIIMNTYNENLHNIIVASLQSQELEKKAAGSQLNASVFTLYYAQGAMATANEQLDAAQQMMEKKAAIKNQVGNSSNVSNNLLSSARNADQYLKQSVTNVSVCASNVQVAATAFVRLASDMGSIFSIISAADFDKDFYQLAKDVRDYINAAAYDAEMASQIAMESSALASEVSTSTVLDKAKSTNTLMNNFLQLISADFDAASQAFATQNAKVTTVFANEKAASGAVKDVSINYLSAISVYGLINKELNLNLTTAPVLGMESTTFKVKFNLIKSAFDKREIPAIPSDELIATNYDIYPVKDYYIIVVKETKKITFSVNDAEDIINTGVKKEKSSGTQIEYIQHVLVNGHQTEAEKDKQKGEKYDVVQPIDIYSAHDPGVFLYDSDGDPIGPGINYVVFVIAVFTHQYKQAINTFDGYLSASSETFSLTNLLKPVSAAAIKVNPVALGPAVSAVAILDKYKVETGTYAEYELKFYMDENPNYKVEYRCMFLPYGDKFLQSLPTGLSNGIPEAANGIQGISKDKYHFALYFNLNIAEQVMAGNYTSAKQFVGGSETNSFTEWIALIGEATTDNFGNPLIADKQYIPVVLTISAESEEMQAQFTNVLSNFNHTRPFTYKKK